MDYGLRVEGPGDLPRDPREACGPPCREILPAGRLVALYFGAEFCEHALPTAAEAEAVCGLARARGLEAVLLTPVATDRGLAAVAGLLEALTCRGLRPAVVFNDWGVLGLLRERFPGHRRRAGRLLNRGLRDPRARSGPGGPDRAGRLRRLLRRQGAVAIETDPDIRGGYLGDGAEGMERVLHLPFAFAASGRNCLVRATHGPGGGFVKTLGVPCGRPCRSGPRRVRRDDTAALLWRAGNTVFSAVPPDRARERLARADRVVLHRRPAP